MPWLAVAQGGRLAASIVSARPPTPTALTTSAFDGQCSVELAVSAAVHGAGAHNRSLLGALGPTGARSWLRIDAALFAPERKLALERRNPERQNPPAPNGSSAKRTQRQTGPAPYYPHKKVRPLPGARHGEKAGLALAGQVYVVGQTLLSTEILCLVVSLVKCFLPWIADFSDYVAFHS